MENNMDVKKFLMENEGYIYSIVKKFRGDVEDLFQVGCIGLLKARNNYDPTSPAKFTTYAYPYIFGEIYKYVLANKNIKLTPDQVKLNTALYRSYDFLSQKLSREPTEEEVALFLGIPVEKIIETKNVMNVLSLDDNRNDQNLYEFIPVYEMNKDDLILLRDALKQLDDTERELIIKRYFYNMTQTEIAREYGTNQVKISREEGRVLTKLRSYM